MNATHLSSFRAKDTNFTRENSGFLCLLFNSCEKPQNFPATIELELITYQNWNQKVTVKNIWASYPKTADDVVTLANWAKNNAYKLRASGFCHTWSPITVPNDTGPCSEIMVVDTRRYLNQMSMLQNSNLVTAQVGVQMDNLLQYIEDRGYGFYNIPVVGDISVGGMLAINAHGNSVPAVGEISPPGHTYGSLSNKIVNFTAVVWDNSTHQYALKLFNRTDPESAAFLVNLGRAFLTEVTLMTGPDYYMRCLSRTDLKASELFANSTTANNTISSFLDQIGRVELIWFGYTETPWVMLRSISPVKPAQSKEVTAPYNYNFSKTVPPLLSNLLILQANSVSALSKLFPQVAFEILKGEMLINGDLWGKSKNVMLYVKPTTVLTSAASFVVQTRRSNLQNVLNEFYNFYTQVLDEFASRNLYPMNFMFSIRFTSLDTAPINGWSIPGISSVRPLNPNFDIAVWFNRETLPDSPGRDEFMTALENFMFTNFHDENAMVTPEWAKQCAFTKDGAFTNTTVLKNILPRTFQNSWQDTVSTLNKYDPHHVFSNAFLDSFFV